MGARLIKALYGLSIVAALVAMAGLLVVLATIRSEALAYQVIGAVAIPVGGAIMLGSATAAWLLDRRTTR